MLVINETRWTGSGQRIFATGEFLLFSGHEESNMPNRQGVAQMMSKAVQRDLIGWEAHGLLILTTCFQTKKRWLNMDITQCFSLMHEIDEDGKGEFYSRLLTIIQTRPRWNIIVPMSDFSTKIGRNSRGYEEIMGQQCSLTGVPRAS